jgi:hypothetical protein
MLPFYPFCRLLEWQGLSTAIPHSASPAQALLIHVDFNSRQPPQQCLVQLLGTRVCHELNIYYAEHSCSLYPLVDCMCRLQRSLLPTQNYKSRQTTTAVFVSMSHLWLEPHPQCAFALYLPSCCTAVMGAMCCRTRLLQRKISF